MTKPPASISHLRQRLRQLHQEQSDLLGVMMECGPMIVGSVYLTYRTCSYPNCRCHKGQKHGPFVAISYTLDGKRRSRPIRAEDVEMVRAKAQAYKRFQTTRTRWRKLCRQCEEVLEKIRLSTAEQYQ